MSKQNKNRNQQGQQNQQQNQSQQNQKEARIHRRQNTLSWPAPMADIRSRIISET